MKNIMVFLIGVAGRSGTGKSLFAEFVKDLLVDVGHISLDDYHKYGREERKKLGISPLNPKANNFQLMEEHIKMIKKGMKFKKPVYDHSKGVIVKDAEVFVPKKIVVVEGLLPFYKKSIRDLFDLKIFFDIDEKIEMKWKIERDIKKRNYKKEWDLDLRKIDAKKYVLPQKKFCEINFHVEESDISKKALKTTVEYKKDWFKENFFDFHFVYKPGKYRIELEEAKMVLEGEFEREMFPEIVKRFEKYFIDVKIPIKMNSFTTAQFLVIYQIFLLLKEGGYL